MKKGLKKARKRGGGTKCHNKLCTTKTCTTKMWYCLPKHHSSFRARDAWRPTKKQKKNTTNQQTYLPLLNERERLTTKKKTKKTTGAPAHAGRETVAWRPTFRRLFCLV
jgi:hypothetical protein